MNTTQLRPLLLRLPLLPGESLLSLIARLAKGNDYEPRSILYSLIRDLGKFKTALRLGCPSQAAQFACIADLTNIPPYQLYNATAHCFAQVLTPPENDIENIELSNELVVSTLSRTLANIHLRQEHAGQFCPQCLKEAAYHRLIWLSRASAACLEHRCLLVNACPGCNQAASISDIVEISCSKCKADLTSAQVVSVDQDSFGLFTQEVIQTWFIKGNSPTSTAYSLPQQRPRDLYRVIEGLRFAVLRVEQDWPLLHRLVTQQNTLNLLPRVQARNLAPYENYCLYTTAFKGIINWPSNFYNFLTVYRERKRAHRDQNGTRGVTNELDLLYSLWLRNYWNHPTLEFVQEAFHQYLVSNPALVPAIRRLNRYKNPSKRAESFPYLTIHEAARLLGVTHKRLTSLVNSGRLAAYIVSYRANAQSYATLVKREDVLELHNEWKHAIELSEVIDWLGLSEEVVLKLVRTGLIKAQHSYGEGSYWMFNSSDITQCLNSFMEVVKLQARGDDEYGRGLLTLRRAVGLLVKVGLDTASTLLQVREGRLCAYHPSNLKFQLGNLLFSRSDINSYIAAVNAEKGWIGVGEVARILKISDYTVLEWVRAGFFSPVAICAKTYYFDRDAIEKFEFNHVFAKEAAKMLGIRERRIPDLVRQGRLNAIRGPIIDRSSYYVFSRENLLQWRDGRVTLGEATILLGVSSRRIVYWVIQGKLVPLEDKTLKPWYFSRQDILALCTSRAEQPDA